MRRVLAVFVSVLLAGVGLAVSPAGGVAGFGDVSAGRFFTEPVQWMVDEEITTGTSFACFSPDDPVTRGQAAAFLWRMEGFPQGAPLHPFTDVVAPWQQVPVSWMADEGITTGTTSTTYAPDDTLTRGQMAALIHRAAGEPASAPPHPFVDVFAPWQQAPVSWMADEGITTGTTPTTFSPDDPVTRGQFAAFSWRWKGEPTVAVDGTSPLCGGRDDFDGGLEQGWSWASGDPALRSFTSMTGYLSITGTPGVTSQILLRDPATDDYEIETKMSYAPFADFQGAGLVVREDSENTVTLVRGFCDPCGGHGIYFDNFVDGGFDTEMVALPPSTDVVYLRIRHANGTYTASFSLDGSSWTDVATRDRLMADPKVGLESGRSVLAPVPTAHFDYFQETAV